MTATPSATTLPDALSADVRALVEREQRLLIGDARPLAADGATLPVHDPSSGAQIATAPCAGPADVDAAVAAARAAFAPGAPWRTISARERERRLHALARLLERDAEQLAQLEALDNGKPLAFARTVDVPEAIAHFEYFAGWPTKLEGATIPSEHAGVLSSTRRGPVGVCAQIVPWNFPLLMAAWKVAPALAAGCTVVLKPAEQTPLTALRLGELALEAGIPPGVLNVLTGDGATGAALVAHPGVDKVAFTGSTAVGREIAATAGRALKRVTLELGGKSANVILPDADVAAAVEGAYTGIYFNSGQACNAASRLLVHADVYDEVLAALADAAAATRVGPAFDPDAFMGPLVSAEQHARVSAYVTLGRDEAELVAGGGTERPGGGWYVEPTLFAGAADDARIVREEIFGPVLVAQPFRTLEEAAARANAGEYGLAAGVWTRDVSNAHRLAALLEAGTVYVNCWGLTSPAVPFGGVKASGLGREHGREGLDAYLETASTFVQL